MDSIRIELEQGFWALGMLTSGQVWGCVYDTFGRPVARTSGWYPTAELSRLEGFVRQVMAFNRHGVR
jgi:hypothetical protein